MNYEEWFRRTEKPDTPENRLALKIAFCWIEAIRQSDFEWMKAHIEAMEHFEGLEHQIGRAHV